MGFSRQEYWSGLPFPSPKRLVKVCKIKMMTVLSKHEAQQILFPSLEVSLAHMLNMYILNLELLGKWLDCIKSMLVVV